MSTNENPLAIKYGEHTLDFAALPQSSLVAMLRRGVSHYLGSEQASKVTAYFDPDKGEPVADTSPEAKAKVKAEYVAKAIDALIAGTVGVSVRGPSVDPIEAIVNRLARKEVLDVLRASGTKPPKKADDKVKFANGAEFTLAELVARRLDADRPSGVDVKGDFGPKGQPHKERLTKEAQKIAKEQQAKADKAKASAAEAGLDAL